MLFLRTNKTKLVQSETNQDKHMEKDLDKSNDKNSSKLSYDEYKRISNMLVYFIRKKEEELDTESNLKDI